MMKRIAAIFLVLISVVLLSSCSSKKEVMAERTIDSGNEKTLNNNKKEALEHFINGSIEESKGNYASAILEYQDALRLDPNAGIYYALAKNYHIINKIPLALQNAKKAIELDTLKVEYYNLLADIFTSAAQYDSAATELEKAISLDSTHVNSYYKLARIYERSKPLKAIEIYNKLTSIIGPDWNVLIRLAELHQNLGNLDEAASSIEELLTIDPANVGIQKLLSEIYLRNNRYEDSKRVIDEIIELTPDDLDARERKAQVFIQQNDWKSAAQQYAYILAQPDVPLDTKIRIGASYFAQSFKDSSLLPVTKELFETIDKDTVDWQVKMYLGAVAINENKDSIAIENFKLVTELANWNVDAWIRLGGLYFDNRKYEEAVKVMNEAIENFPQNFTVNLILGLSLAQSDKHSEAKKYLQKSVELNPSDITALSAYGYTLNQLKENDESIIYLNKALQIDPDNVNLLGTLGLIYDSMEKWAECDSVYERALQLDSTSALVNNNYAYSLSERGERLEKALAMVKISIEADPDNSSYLDTIGWVYFKLGDYQRAKEYIEKAIEVGGESAVMLEHLGDILYKLGNKNSAMEFWQKALTLDTSNNELKNKIEKGEI